MNKKSIDVLGATLNCFTLTETLDLVVDAVKNKKNITYGDLNANSVNLIANRNETILEFYKKIDVVNPDGQPIVWAIRLLTGEKVERVSGCDLMQELVAVAAKEGFTIFFLGAEESSVKKMVSKYRDKYGEEIISGYRNGYYSNEEEGRIVSAIANLNPDILFIGNTSPKKEEFLLKYHDELKYVPFKMGVGGSFDVVSGKTKRAPLWMQNAGLEWFFRLVQEPKRMWKRYLIGNTRFILLVLKERFRSKKGRSLPEREGDSGT